MPDQKKRTVVHQLETLRVLAMLWIFVYHLWSEAPEAVAALPLGSVLTFICRYGFLGVMVFNAVTGFVLALPHLGAESRPIPAQGEFLRKRFWRICPPYYLALTFWTAVALLFSAWSLGPAAAGDKGSFLISYLLHLGFLHDFSRAHFFSIVPAYWWLGLLAQFYLLFPPVMRLFLRLGPGRALAASFLGCWGLWEALTLAASAFPDSPLAQLNQMWLFHLPARLPEFAFGMWLASRWKSEETDGRACRFGLQPGELSGLSLAAFLVILSLGALIRPSTMPLEHFFLTLASLAGLLAALFHPLTERLGRATAIVRVSAASYGLYLMHQPILYYLDRWLEPRLGAAAEFWALLVVGGGLSWGAALGLDRAVARLSDWRIRVNSTERGKSTAQ